MRIRLKPQYLEEIRKGIFSLEHLYKSLGISHREGHLGDLAAISKYAADYRLGR